MRVWNRAKLLWGYLARRSKLGALPVEYIVETTAKCNLYCPMCPRETHKQPKEDMSDAVFNRLIEQAGATAEHMMLIGLGEPLMDPRSTVASSSAIVTASRRCFRRTAHCSTSGTRRNCSIRRSNRSP